MGANSSTLSSAQGNKTRYFLKDVVLEHTDEDTKGKHQSLNVAELVILGPKNRPGGYSFPLVRVSPKQWKAEGALAIMFRVRKVGVIARSEEGKDIGSLHLNPSTLQTTSLGSEGGKPAQIQRMETADEELHLTLFWRICEIPEPVEVLEELTTMLDGLEDLLNNKLFGDIGRPGRFLTLEGQSWHTKEQLNSLAQKIRTFLTGSRILEPH
ncbi:hypothetical protein H1R20_g6977, partial [Candolleomyces eurysporus]